MQTTFGPFYPSPLQESVNHAERFGEELALLAMPLPFHDPGPMAAHDPPRSEAPMDALAARWICGREGELEAFVSDVVSEWRAKRVSAVGAANVIDRYLDGLHEGLAAFFGHAAPSCCSRPSVTRIALSSLDAPTQIAPFLEILAQSIRPAAGAPPRT